MNKKETDKMLTELRNQVLEFTLSKGIYRYEEIGFKIERLIKSLGVKNKEYYQGRLDELFEMLNHSQETANNEVQYKKCISKSEFTYKAAKILIEKGTISHSELAELLGVSKSHMTNISKQLENFNIVYTRKVGRSKYYSVSHTGKGLDDYVKKNNINTSNKKLGHSIIGSFTKGVVSSHLATKKLHRVSHVKKPMI